MGASERVVSWELHVVRVVPIIPKRRSTFLVDIAKTLSKSCQWALYMSVWEHSMLILTISMNRRCLVSTEETLPHLFLCWSHPNLAQSTQRCCWNLAILHMAGNGQGFFSIFHWNKHTFFPIVPWVELFSTRRGWEVRCAQECLRIWVFTKMS